MKVVIGIATAGRGAQMPSTVGRIAACQPLPSALIVCPAEEADFSPACSGGLGFPVHVVRSERKGASSQRNAILASIERLVPDATIIVFFDDDFYPCADYIGQLMDVFSANPSVVATCGKPEWDGATGPGISPFDALSKVESMDAESAPSHLIEDTYGTYGCNMAFRLDLVNRLVLRFDEQLPLYSWLEDIDFSRRLSAYGRIITSQALRGVHLGLKSGKGSGVRFGYSQVANPMYCIRKGSMSAHYGVRQMTRNLVMNLVRSVNPEPWVDRTGRVKGNLLALADLVRGRLHPSRILEL